MGQESLFAAGSITYDSKALEAFYTPGWLADYAVNNILTWESGANQRVLEPHGGGAAFIRSLLKRGNAIVESFDVDRNCCAVQEHGAQVFDFLQYKAPSPVNRWDAIIANPPFDNAEEHLELALQLAPQVVFILPVSRLETRTRAAFYNAAPLESVTLLPERIWAGSRHVGIFRFVRSFTGRAGFELDPSAVQPQAE